MKAYQIITGDGTSFIIYCPDDLKDPLDSDSIQYVDKDSIIAIVNMDKALKYEREWKTKNADLVIDLRAADTKHHLLADYEGQEAAKAQVNKEPHLSLPRGS